MSRIKMMPQEWRQLASVVIHPGPTEWDDALATRDTSGSRMTATNASGQRIAQKVELTHLNVKYITSRPKEILPKSGWCFRRLMSISRELELTNRNCSLAFMLIPIGQFELSRHRHKTVWKSTPVPPVLKWLNKTILTRQQFYFL